MTKEEWIAFKNLELTGKWFEYLQEGIENIKTQWVYGNLIGQEEFQRGVVEGLTRAMEGVDEE